MCWAPERRELQIGEGGGFSGGTSVHSSIKVGAYAGRFNNPILAGMNKPSPNLTTIYLDNPIVVPTPEPLEYFPSPGRHGQPRGYPLIITGGGPSTSGFKISPPTPNPLHSTHPWMHPSTSRAQPRRVIQPTTGHDKNWEIRPQGGNPWQNFGRRVWRGLTPPRTPTGTVGGVREATGLPAETSTGPENN